MTITDPGVLGDAMWNRLSEERYAALAPAFSDAMVAADVTTPERAAMWCAQIGHESGGLLWMEEIASGAAYEWRQDLGNTMAGDGTRYKGRGPIQVTGRHNYGECSRWAFDRGLVPSPTFFVDNPAELSSDRYGFIGPVWYWTTRNLNAYADRRDIVGATRIINGGTNGLDDRTNRYTYCLNMGDRILPGPVEDEVTPEQIDEIVNRCNKFTADFIKGYVGPVISDTKDNREQLAGSRDLVLYKDGSVNVEASWPGWKQLGGHTVVDALALVGEKLGLEGFGFD